MVLKSTVSIFLAVVINSVDWVRTSAALLMHQVPTSGVHIYVWFNNLNVNELTIPFPSYDDLTKSCKFYSGLFCNRRKQSKFNNNQCYSTTFPEHNHFMCLNRMDISEGTIKNSSVYNIEISKRRNLFKVFKGNSSHNSIVMRTFLGNLSANWLWGNSECSSNSSSQNRSLL